MSISKDQRATAESLGPAAGRLLDLVEERPELLARRHHEPLFEAAREILPVLLTPDPEGPYALQPWPLLTSPERDRELAVMSVAVARLVRSVPRRAFASDPRRVQRHYGLESEMLATLLLGEPHGMEEALCRLDVVDTADGPRCVELNAGNVSGWQEVAVTPAFLEASPFAGLLEELGARWHDVTDGVLRHMVRTCAAAGLGGDGPLNLAIVAAAGPVYGLHNHALGRYQTLFRAALEELAPGRGGRLHVVTPDGLDVRGVELVVGGDPIHGVLEATDEPTPRLLFRAFKAGGLKLFSAPVGPLVLGDKRNLALLSTALERPDLLDPPLDADERRAVERWLPWTRRVTRDATASFRGGRRRALQALLMEERQELVLKAALSYGGNEVVLGRGSEPAAWRRAVDQALDADGAWVVQELLDTPTYPLQYGDDGWAPHRVVWGSFVLGDAYGGVSARAIPADRGRVVNIARGAKMAMIFVA